MALAASIPLKMLAMGLGLSISPIRAATLKQTVERGLFLGTTPEVHTALSTDDGCYGYGGFACHSTRLFAILTQEI